MILRAKIASMRWLSCIVCVAGCGLALLWPSIALAEQPHGTYTLDRSSLTHMTDGEGNRHPSCGGEKLFGGQATFVVEYTAEKILVNRRKWRFKGYGVVPGEKKRRPDAPVIIVDPESKDAITLWFSITDHNGSAFGLLTVKGTRDGEYCVDAWKLLGNYAST